MPNNSNQLHATPNKDFSAEFTKLIESAVELDEKSARELLNKILSSK